jgi:hypothetical protein
MPNITPQNFRQLYNLYQGKNNYGLFDFDMQIKQRIEKISRIVSTSQGVSPRFQEKMGAAV